MADLDFKHHVSEIPRGEASPQPYKREVGVAVGQTPDFQSVLSNYGASTNWMSELGAHVAATASNAIATKLGGELGKNPKGNLGPALTQFDKQFEQSYATQAQSTLGLQAQKLITDANIELASAPRLDAETIAQSQQQVAAGLQKIFSYAPDSIRANMEYHFGGVMISQGENLAGRLITEQKEDRKNTLNLANKNNTENAYSLGFSGVDPDKEGDSKTALEVLKKNEEANRVGVANQDISAEQAQIRNDTAWLSYYSGRETAKALKADSEKKLPEQLKNLADNKSIPVKYRQGVYNNVLQYMNLQGQLRAQDQQLKLAKFNVQLAEDPSAITGAEFSALQAQLTPIQAQKAKLDLIQALSKKTSDNNISNELMSDWGNSDAHARAGEKARNDSFDTLVQRVVTESKGETGGEQAQVQVAAASGAPVPVFTKSLQYKLSSGNPQLMESAAQQMHQLYQMGAGHALSDLTEKDKAMFGAIETLRSALDPTEAMREAANKIYNQDPVMYKANQQKWSNYLSLKTKETTDVAFALKKFGYDGKDFLNPSVAQVYGTDMLEKYAINYQLLGGDETTAFNVTKRYIDENYGNTGMNGGDHSTLHPLEKVLGYHTNDVVPTIQQDVANQMSARFLALKEAFSNGKANEYWEVQPISGAKHGYLAPTYDPIKVKRYTKTPEGIKSEVFDIVIQGNAFDNWDMAVYSKSGLRPLYQVAPYLGVVNYVPNKAWIDKEYLRRHA